MNAHDAPMTLAFVGVSVRNAPFFVALRRVLESEIRCVYYARKEEPRGIIRRDGAPLYPRRQVPFLRTKPTISDEEVIAAIGKPELVERYAGRIEEARGHIVSLCHFLDTARVGAVFLWNGYSLTGALTAYLARQRKIPVLFGEHGYFPGSMQIDPEGVNFDSSASRLIRAGEGRLPPDPILDAAIDDLIARYRGGEPMRAQRTSMPSNLQPDWRARAVTTLRRINATKRREDAPVAAEAPKPVEQRVPLPDRFVLLPFQVADDSQLFLHSPLVGSDMIKMLDLTRRALAQVAPDTSVVAKLHPSEKPSIVSRQLDVLRGSPDVVVASGYAMPELLARASAVVTVNSTVGFEAFLVDKPVVALGRNFYVAPGLVEVVRETAELPLALARALGHPVDVQRRREFLRFVHARFLTFCSYYDLSERSLNAAASRIRSLLLPRLKTTRSEEPA